jgi:hypothetical protein
MSEESSDPQIEEPELGEVLDDQDEGPGAETIVEGHAADADADSPSKLAVALDSPSNLQEGTGRGRGRGRQQGRGRGRGTNKKDVEEASEDPSAKPVEAKPKRLAKSRAGKTKGGETSVTVAMQSRAFWAYSGDKAKTTAPTADGDAANAVAVAADEQRPPEGDDSSETAPAAPNLCDVFDSMAHAGHADAAHATETGATNPETAAKGAALDAIVDGGAPAERLDVATAEAANADVAIVEQEILAAIEEMTEPRPGHLDSGNADQKEASASGAEASEAMDPMVEKAPAAPNLCDIVDSMAHADAAHAAETGATNPETAATAEVIWWTDGADGQNEGGIGNWGRDWGLEWVRLGTGREGTGDGR